jgi:hypothetical protein
LQPALPSIRRFSVAGGQLLTGGELNLILRHRATVGTNDFDLGLGTDGQVGGNFHLRTAGIPIDDLQHPDLAVDGQVDHSAIVAELLTTDRHHAADHDRGKRTTGGSRIAVGIRGDRCGGTVLDTGLTVRSGRTGKGLSGKLSNPRGNIANLRRV